MFKWILEHVIPSILENLPHGLGTILALTVGTMCGGWLAGLYISSKLRRQVRVVMEAAEEVGRHMSHPIPHFQHYRYWDSRKIRRMIRQARERVLILHTWFPDEADLEQWEFSESKPKVTILLASPKSPAVRERARFRYGNRGAFSDEAAESLITGKVDSCRKTLGAIFEKHGLNGLVKTYAEGMPFGPIYVIDDDVFFGIYPPDQSSNAAPMFRVPSDGDVGRLLVDTFKTFEGSCDRIPASPADVRT